MLLGRFIPVIAPLALAASLAGKKPTPFTVGTHADRHLHVRVRVVGNDHPGRRAAVLAGGRAGAGGRAFWADALSEVKYDWWDMRCAVPPYQSPTTSQSERDSGYVEHADSGTDAAAVPSPDELKLGRRHSRKAGLFEPELLKAAFKQSLVMLRPDIQWKNPVMFVVEVGTVLTIIYTVAKLLGYQSAASVGYLWRWISGWWRPCCSPISPRPLPRRAARPRPTPCGRRAATTPGPPHPLRTARIEHDRSRPILRAGDTVEVVAGRGDPQRRRNHRGRGLDRRIGHHRRVGPRDPRGRRRPLAA